MPGEEKVTPVGTLKPLTGTPKPVGKLRPFTPVNEPYTSPYQSILQDQEGQADKEARIEHTINSIPGLSDAPNSSGKKEILRDLVRKNAPKEVIRESMDVLTGTHPNQKGGVKYYMDENGVPKPLADNERPPAGYDVASHWGTQKEANDDTFITSAAKHAVNGLIGAAEGVVNLGDLAQGLLTGTPSETAQKLKNGANALKFETKDVDPLFHTEGVKKYSDLLDPDRYHFNFDNVGENILQGMESLISFAVGTKGFSAASKGVKAFNVGAKGLEGAAAQTAMSASKLESKALAAAGAYNLAATQMADVADDAGLDGQNKYNFVAVAAVPQALLESMFGVEGLFTRNAVARQELNSLAKIAATHIEKDAAGKITKEGLSQLNREMTVAASQVAKKYLKETTRTVGEEAGTEVAQQFAEEASKQLYDKLAKDPKFKDVDAFSPKSMGNYINAGIGGALGSIGPSVVLNSQANRIEREKAQSENVYEQIKKGDDAVKAFKHNVQNAQNNGEITPDQAKDAMTRLNAYKEYNDIITSTEVKLDDAQKKEVFEKTFEKQNLESQLEAIGKPEKLHPLMEAEYKAKEKMANDLQKDITDILTTARVKDATIAGKKSINDVAKSDQKEAEEAKPTTKEGVKKPSIHPALQALQNRFGKPTEAKSQYDGKTMEEIPSHVFNRNSLHDRIKHKVTYDWLSKQPQERTEGTVEEVPFTEWDNNGKENSTARVRFADNRTIKFSSSMIRATNKDDKTLGGHRGHLEEQRIKPGEKVGMKAVNIRVGDKSRPAIKVFNAKTGRFVGWAKETRRGQSDWGKTPGMVEALLDEQIKDEPPILPPEKEFNTPHNPISPVIDNVTNALRTSLQPNQVQIVEDTHGKEENTVGAQSEAGNDQGAVQKANSEGAGREEGKGERTVEEKLASLKSNLVAYNNLSKKDKQTNQDLRNSIFYDARDIGHKIKPLKSSNLTLLRNGVRVMDGSKRRPARPKEAIEAEKYAKAFRKRALNAEPVSIRHAVIMDIANGQRFNQKELINLTHIPSANIPLGLTQKGGGISIEFYSNHYLEMGGLLSKGVDDIKVAQEAANVVAEMATSGYRRNAIQMAEEMLFRMENNGMSKEDIEGLEQAARLHEEMEGENEAKSANVEKEVGEMVDNIEGLNDPTIDQIAKDREAFEEWYKAYRSSPEAYAKYQKEQLESEGLLDHDLDKTGFYDEYFKSQYEKLLNGTGVYQKRSQRRDRIRVEKVVEVIRKNFPKVKIVYDGTLNGAGKLQGNTLIINPYYAGSDTPIHEAAHIMLDAMGENKVVKAAIKQLKGTKLWDEIAKSYPELDEKALGNEVLAEAIGREGADIFNTEVEKSGFRVMLDYIFDWIKRNFGVEKNIAKNLARQIIAGNKTKNLTGKEGVERNQIIGEKGSENMPEVANNLKVAKQMELSGENAKTIYLATGWQKRLDGHWKYDLIENKSDFSIDKDGLDKLTSALKDNPNSTAKSDLGNLFRGSTVLKVYPELKDIKIELFYDDKTNKKGAYSPKTNTIFLNIADNRGIEESGDLNGFLRSTIVHEVQHVIQKIEGFEPGGNPTTAPQEKLKEIILRKRQNQIDLLKSLLPKSTDNFTKRDAEMQSVVDKMEKENEQVKSADLSFHAYKRLMGEIEARNSETRLMLSAEERKNTPISETEDINDDEQLKNETSASVALSVNKKSKFNKYRETIGRDIDEERNTIDFIEEALDREDLSDEDYEILNNAYKVITEEIQADKKSYDEFVKSGKKLRDIASSDDLNEFTLEELTSAFHEADAHGQEQLKPKIADYIRRRELNRLKGKVSNIEEIADTKDLGWIERLFRPLSALTHHFPVLQGLNKEFERRYIEYRRESEASKKQLEKLGKAVIKSYNKDVLGIVSDLVRSDSAKYFKFLDGGNGKLISSTSAMNQAQREFYDFFKGLIEKRNQSLKDDSDIADNTLLLTDRGVQETWREDGFKAAMKLYFNVTPDNSLDYEGNLTSKFSRPYKGANYSKDFYKAAHIFIEDYYHVKNMKDMVPIVMSAKKMYEQFGFDADPGSTKFKNVQKFLDDWQQSKLYKKQGVTEPHLDAALKFLRKFGSVTTMAFNWTANLFNLGIGLYNSWKADTSKELAIGLGRILGGGRKFDKEHGFGTLSKKAIDALTLFDVVHEDVDSNPLVNATGILSNIAMAGTKWSEYLIQGSQFLGQLTDEDWNNLVYDEKGNLTMKEKIAKDGESFDDKMIQYKNHVTDIQGKYSEKDRRNFMNYEYGKVVSQYKNWMPEWWRARFGKAYIDAYNKEQGGAARPVFDAVKSEYDNTGISVQFFNNLLKKGISELADDFSNPKERIWNNKKTMSNLKGAMSIALLMTLVYGDDDDDKKAKYKAMSLNNALDQVLFVYDPNQLKFIADRPVAAIGVVKNFITVFQDMADYEDKKFKKDVLKVTPYGKIVTQAENFTTK